MDDSFQKVRVTRCLDGQSDLPNVDLEFVLSNNFDGVWRVNNQLERLYSHPIYILVDLEKIVCTFFLIGT